MRLSTPGPPPVRTELVEVQGFTPTPFSAPVGAALVAARELRRTHGRLCDPPILRQAQDERGSGALRGTTTVRTELVEVRLSTPCPPYTLRKAQDEGGSSSRRSRGPWTRASRDRPEHLFFDVQAELISEGTLGVATSIFGISGAYFGRASAARALARADLKGANGP